MTYYAITKGEYSDYHICAITADKDKAEVLKRLFSDEFDKAEIEEYANAENGEDGEVRVLWLYYANQDVIEAVNCGGQEGFCEYKDGDCWGVKVYAKDADHARKKAQDMIAKRKAELAGI